jgi:hypothetical protein
MRTTSCLRFDGTQKNIGNLNSKGERTTIGILIRARTIRAGTQNEFRLSFVGQSQFVKAARYNPVEKMMSSMP